MVILNDNEGHGIQCPFCNSEALYKYGKIRTGKQRYLCIMCGKQFTPSSRRLEVPSLRKLSWSYLYTNFKKSPPFPLPSGIKDFHVNPFKGTLLSGMNRMLSI